MGSSHRLSVGSALVAGEVVPGDVSIRDGRVEAVGLPASGAARGMAVPAFVDLQVNGLEDVHFSGAPPEGFGAGERALAGRGVVFALPTLLNTTLEGYRSALEALDQHRRIHPGSGLLGAHLEGPWLSADWHGAHDPSNFRSGNLAEAEGLLRAGPVRMVTLAPEVPGVAEVIGVLVGRGVVVSVGHSDATAAQCAAAGAAGVRTITHCWNAHRRLAARDPGPAGWALGDRGVTVGLVADGLHVSPEVLAMTFNAARGRIAATTDAVAVRGRDRELGRSGGLAVTRGGTIAGSLATQSSMLRALDAAGVDRSDAFASMHAPQAALLGLEPWWCRPGDPAHVTVLDDALEVRQTWREGERLH